MHLTVRVYLGKNLFHDKVYFKFFGVFHVFIKVCLYSVYNFLKNVSDLSVLKT